jgi:hypothetical protein
VNPAFRQEFARAAALAMVGHPDLLPRALDQAKQARRLKEVGLELHVAGIHAAAKAGQAELAREWARQAVNAKPVGLPLRIGATALADEEQMRAMIAADLATLPAVAPKPAAPAAPAPRPGGPEAPPGADDF